MEVVIKLDKAERARFRAMLERIQVVTASLLQSLDRGELPSEAVEQFAEISIATTEIRVQLAQLLSTAKSRVRGELVAGAGELPECREGDEVILFAVGYLTSDPENVAGVDLHTLNDFLRERVPEKQKQRKDWTAGSLQSLQYRHLVQALPTSEPLKAWSLTRFGRGHYEKIRPTFEQALRTPEPE